MKIMSVDLGDVRTGLAMCDRTEMLASPLGIIEDKNIDSIVQKVAVAAKEHAADMIVVGHPKHMNGSAGDRAKKSEDFANILRELTNLPVTLWDERGTTVSAIGYLNETNTRGKKRKQVVDAVAAVIILENYIAYRKNHPEETVNNAL